MVASQKEGKKITITPRSHNMTNTVAYKNEAAA
jgi:hypothetical protein